MSKSYAAEIIAILYFILSTQLHGFWVYVALFFAVVGVIESIYYSIKEYRGKLWKANPRQNDL